MSVRVATSPFSFTHTVPIRSFSQGRSKVVLGENQVNVPSGAYVIIESAGTPGGDYERDQVALRVAEIAGLITLRFPQALNEKIYEGWVNTERSAVLLGEGPLRLSVSPTVTSSELVEGLGIDDRSIQQFERNRREGFQLASRWFRCGHEALNPVDKFLFWWTVLKIYPGKGKTTYVKNIKQVLRDRVCPNSSLQDLER